MIFTVFASGNDDDDDNDNNADNDDNDCDSNGKYLFWRLVDYNLLRKRPKNERT